MSALHIALLYAATVNSQLTTSILLPMDSYGTDKIGFLGSVGGANETHTTIALEYDNGTDWQALELPRNVTPATVTIGPNMYEAAQDLYYLAQGIRTTEGDYMYKVHCDLPSKPTANASCIASYGPLAGAIMQCQVGGSYTSTTYETNTHTYTPRGSVSGGVEMLTRTMVLPEPRENRPDWCGEESYSPEESYVTEFQVEPTYIAMYQVVVTAGEEKLGATSRASATPGTATPTSSLMPAASNVDSAVSPSATGAAACMVMGRRAMFGVVAVVILMV
ncbi:hypothetical protein IAQ61_002193 [Plenodomus lingam]|uniref:Uncharacterized protein n=1 Tax=Leptosphaeria maculans (strain JN3 / isolate v23.1.3 / race Av1-4-5-6-7-8) TaxID=985895 RepID=E4ZHD5_LEPMJ|nr:hypothetical protein LEMA_P057390.1 [Plenodomus lingam JN3]KAH9876832.1 hypothetical protein IAQ61_002193 [Plenodomus lingam]CBX90705.1 hypothetical protein LEMA_P057390.1 [Plenodomus lingam JN3]